MLVLPPTPPPLPAVAASDARGKYNILREILFLSPCSFVFVFYRMYVYDVHV